MAAYVTNNLEVAAEIPKAFKPLFEPYRHKVFHGGRGSSKSWSVGRALVLRSAMKEERVLCGREYQTSIKGSAKSLIEDQIRLLKLQNYFDITADEIRNKLTNSIFTFYGFRRDPQKVKSTEGTTIAWIEEANSMSQESLDLLIPTVRQPNSEIWYTLNRYHESDPVDAMFISGDAKRSDTYVRQVNYDENKFFPEVLRVEMEWDKARDTDKYNHIWLGMPLKHSEATVFKDWRVDGEIVPPKDARFYYGADWGFSVDPSVLLRCWVDEEKRILYVDYEAYGVGVEIDDLPALFNAVPDAKKWKIKADSARPETISYMNRKGFKIESAKKGAGSVEEGVEFLKSYTIVVHERCKHVVDELTHYKYKVDKLTGDVLPILTDKNNHCIDALRYALEGVLRKIIFHIG